MARRRIGFDRSAYAFAVAARLTDATQIRAVNGLTIGTKFDGLWPLIQCLYPFVGGDAARHSWNAKNVATNRITWVAATHNSNGVTLGAGGNSTGYAPPNNNPYLGTYITGGAGGTGADFFADGSAGLRIYFYTNFGGTSYSDLGNASTGRITSNTLTTTNRYSATTRINGTSHIFRNGASVASGNTTAPETNPRPLLSLGGPVADGATGRRTALCVIADSLTPAQHTLLYGHIQAYQTALGRAVAP
jgi:hypothetical protein